MLSPSEKTKDILSVSSFFFLTILLFAPAQIYYTNYTQFPYFFYEPLPYIIATVLFLAIALTAVFRTLPGFVYQKVISLFFALSFLLWLQGNIIVWDYGVAYGENIPWDRHILKGWVDSAIWIVLIIISLLASSFVKKLVRKGSLFFVSVQLLVTLFSACQVQENLPYKYYVMDKVNKFSFSSDKNVILLIFDGYQSDIFKEIIQEDEHYSKIFDGFTYFPNAVSGYTFTSASIPLMLTGTFYDNSVSRHSYIRREFLRNSLPRILTENGYRVEIYPKAIDTVLYDSRCASNIRPKKDFFIFTEEKMRLFDVALFRFLPHFAKKYIFKNERWLLAQTYGTFKKRKDNPRESVSRKKPFIPEILSPNLLRHSSAARFSADMVIRAQVQTGEAIFKFIHFDFPQTNLCITEDLRWEIRHYNRKNYKGQAKAILKLVELFLNKLKDVGIYDNSLIYIVADHGSGKSDDMHINPSGWSEKYRLHAPIQGFQRFKAKSIPLILVKPLNSKAPLAISPAPVTLQDIPQTTISLLGIRGDFSGMNMFDIGQGTHRKRRCFLHTWAGRYNVYMKPLYEYIVSGDSWMDKSWYLTYRRFTLKGIEYYTPEGKLLKKKSWKK